MSEYRIVGKGYKRTDIADKVTGKEHFVGHIRPDNLLHARAVRPQIAGAMPESVDAASMGCAKPDPRIFARACELAGVRAHQVLHVGDDPHLDVRGAQAAGLQAVWLRRPSLAHRHATDACGPDYPLAPCEDLRTLDAWLSTVDGD